MKSLIFICLFAMAIAAPSRRAPSFLQKLGLKRSKYIDRGGSRYDFEQTSGTRFDSSSQPRDEYEDDRDPRDVSSFVIYVRPDGYISVVTYVTEEEEEPPGAGYPALMVASMTG